MAVPAYAAYPVLPLDQHQSDISMDMIQCNDGKLLMMTFAGKPVCVTSDSTMQLADRGYATAYTPETSQKANESLNEKITNQTDTHVFTDKEKQIIADYRESSMLSSEPSILIHMYSIELPTLPKVGQTALVNFTGVYTDKVNFEPYKEPFTLKVFSGTEDKVRFLDDAVTNAGTDDPDVFVPFDNDVGYVVNDPVLGRAYTVLVTVEILEEGFIHINALRFNGAENNIGRYFAISDEHSMIIGEYIDEGYTFLDHTIVDLYSNIEHFTREDKILSTATHARSLRVWGEMYNMELYPDADGVIQALTNMRLPLDDAERVLNYTNFTSAQVANILERYKSNHTTSSDVSSSSDQPLTQSHGSHDGCGNYRIFLKKISSGDIVCVFVPTAEKLIIRGWGDMTHEPHDIEISFETLYKIEPGQVRTPFNRDSAAMLEGANEQFYDYLHKCRLGTSIANEDIPPEGIPGGCIIYFPTLHFEFKDFVSILRHNDTLSWLDRDKFS